MYLSFALIYDAARSALEFAVFFPHLSPIVVPSVVFKVEGHAGRTDRKVCDSLRPSLKIHLGAPPISLTVLVIANSIFFE